MKICGSWGVWRLNRQLGNGTIGPEDLVCPTALPTPTMASEFTADERVAELTDQLRRSSSVRMPAVFPLAKQKRPRTASQSAVQMQRWLPRDRVQHNTQQQRERPAAAARPDLNTLSEALRKGPTFGTQSSDRQHRDIALQHQRTRRHARSGRGPLVL